MFAGMLDAQPDGPEAADEKAEKARRQELEKLLGPQRLAAYERAVDPRFQEPYQIGQQFDLPPQTTVQVYELRKLAEKEWSQISRAEDLSADDRAAERLRVATEMPQALGRILRGPALEEYLKRDPFWFRISRDTEAKPDGGNPP